MNKIALISISLIVFLIGIGCAAATDAPALGSGLGGGGDNGPFYCSCDSVDSELRAPAVDAPAVNALSLDSKIGGDEDDSFYTSGGGLGSGLCAPALGSGLGGGGNSNFY